MNSIGVILKKYSMRIALFMVMAITMTFFGDTAPYYSFAAEFRDDDSGESTKEKLDEAQAEMEEKQRELQAAQSQLQSTQNSLDSLEATQDSYQVQMDSLNIQLQLCADNLAVIEASLDLKNLELEQTTAALDEATLLRETQYESMKYRIQFLYEGGEESYMDILFSANSFGEFLNYADYIEELSAYDRRMLNEYIDTQNTISENKAIIEEELAEIEILEAQAVEQQDEINSLINETASYMSSNQNAIDGMAAQMAAYEADCDAKQAAADAAAADYATIKAQYDEELRLANLARAAQWRDISEVTFDEADRTLLANLIYCEAGGESYDGQLAVGAVVINRVLSSKYPDTVTGVIYQNKQFSPVLDGHLAAALASDKATDSCYAAADEAMSGATNVGNCLYFRTPLEGLTGIEIGHHIFY